MYEAIAAPAPALVVAARTTKGAAVRIALLLLLASATILQRFGVNGLVSGTFVVGYVFLTVAAFAGALLVSVKRLLLYGLCIGIATASLLLNSDQGPSVASLALIVVMYLPFVFSLKPNFLAASDAAWAMQVSLNFTLAVAIAGILQFCAQFFIHADWLFNFEPYIPAFLRGPGAHNTVISVGSHFKANGFFFNEPSGYSFFMALGLLAESATHRRVSRLACLGLALVLSYSGTGLLTLLIGVLFPLGRRTLQRMLLLAIVGGLAVWLLSDALNLSFTLGRIAEFQDARSSGYIRYIAPMRVIADTWHTEAWTLWLGHGPGMLPRRAFMFETHDPTWAKLLFEYGGLGFVAFVALVISTLRSSSAPIQLRAALFFCWLIMGGNLLSAELNFLMLGIVGFIPRAAPLPLRERL